MAEGLMNEKIKKYNIKNLVIKSAGTHALEGGYISSNSVKALKDKNIDISNYKSKLINDKIIKEASLVLTMGQGHKSYLLANYPDFQNKIFTIKEFILNTNDDILDPFGGNINLYIEVRDQLDFLTEKLARRLRDDNRYRQ